ARRNLPYSRYLTARTYGVWSKPPRLWVASNPASCGRTGAPDIGWGAISGTTGTVGHIIHSSPLHHRWHSLRATHGGLHQKNFTPTNRNEYVKPSCPTIKRPQPPPCHYRPVSLTMSPCPFL